MARPSWPATSSATRKPPERFGCSHDPRTENRRDRRRQRHRVDDSFGVGSNGTAAGPGRQRDSLRAKLARLGGVALVLHARRDRQRPLQQFVLFTAGSLALAVNLPPDQLDIIGAVSIVFVVMRLAFWIGYRIWPIYR